MWLVSTLSEPFVSSSLQQLPQRRHSHHEGKEPLLRHCLCLVSPPQPAFEPPLLVVLEQAARNSSLWVLLPRAERDRVPSHPRLQIVPNTRRSDLETQPSCERNEFEGPDLPRGEENHQGCGGGSEKHRPTRREAADRQTERSPQNNGDSDRSTSSTGAQIDGKPPSSVCSFGWWLR